MPSGHYADYFAAHRFSARQIYRQYDISIAEMVADKHRAAVVDRRGKHRRVNVLPVKKYRWRATRKSFRHVFLSGAVAAYRVAQSGSVSITLPRKMRIIDDAFVAAHQLVTIPAAAALGRSAFMAADRCKACDQRRAMQRFS